MQVVGLKQRCLRCHAVEQEVYQRRLPGFGDLGEDLVELQRVLAVVGWDSLTDQQHAGILLLGSWRRWLSGCRALAPPAARASRRWRRGRQ
jgi:hypothetical protein